MRRKKRKKEEQKNRRTDIARLADQHAVFDDRLAVGARLPQTLDLRGEARDVGVDVEHDMVKWKKKRRIRFFVD